MMAIVSTATIDQSRALRDTFYRHLAFKAFISTFSAVRLLMVLQMTLSSANTSIVSWPFEFLSDFPVGFWPSFLCLETGAASQTAAGSPTKRRQWQSQKGHKFDFPSKTDGIRTSDSNRLSLRGPSICSYYRIGSLEMGGILLRWHLLWRRTEKGECRFP